MYNGKSQSVQCYNRTVKYTPSNKQPFICVMCVRSSSFYLDLGCSNITFTLSNLPTMSIFEESGTFSILFLASFKNQMLCYNITTNDSLWEI